jgi:hypothetical protein
MTSSNQKYHGAKHVITNTFAIALGCASKAHSKNIPVSIVSVVAQRLFQEQRRHPF